MPPISKAPLLELILNSQRIKGGEGVIFFLFVLRKPSLPSKQFPGSCCGNAQTPAGAACGMCLCRQFGIFGNKHRQALLTAHRIHSPLSEQALEQEATTKNSFPFQQVCSTRGEGNRWKWCSTIKDNLRYQHLHKCSGSPPSSSSSGASLSEVALFQPNLAGKQRKQTHKDPTRCRAKGIWERRTLPATSWRKG